MLSTIDLLHLCQDCLSSASITAGPDGRDGANVISAPGETVVVFRGTLCQGEVAFLDWLNDLRLWQVRRPEYEGSIHHGFADSMDDLWPKLDILGGNVTFTGHSKGGALAQLAAARYLSGRSRADGVRVVTFGAPKVGDRTFADSLSRHDGLVTLYENHHDIVPRLPHFGYQSAAFVVSSPLSWIAPHGIIANHHLLYGYLPWIETLPQAA